MRTLRRTSDPQAVRSHGGSNGTEWPKHHPPPRSLSAAQPQRSRRSRTTECDELLRGLPRSRLGRQMRTWDLNDDRGEKFEHRNLQKLWSDIPVVEAGAERS